MTNPPRDPMPPHDERSERVLLAGLFRDPALVGAACERHGVAESDLFFYSHRVVWRAVWTLINAGVEPTLATVYQMLLIDGTAKELDRDNPALWLAELYDEDPTGAWCDWAARVVLRDSARRASIYRANEMLRDAYDGTKGTDEYARQLG